MPTSNNATSARMMDAVTASRAMAYINFFSLRSVLAAGVNAEGRRDWRRDERASVAAQTILTEISLLKHPAVYLPGSSKQRTSTKRQHVRHCPPGPITTMKLRHTQQHEEHGLRRTKGAAYGGGEVREGRGVEESEDESDYAVRGGQWLIKRTLGCVESRWHG